MRFCHPAYAVPHRAPSAHGRLPHKLRLFHYAPSVPGRSLPWQLRSLALVSPGNLASSAHAISAALHPHSHPAFSPPHRTIMALGRWKGSLRAVDGRFASTPPASTPPYATAHLSSRVIRTLSHPAPIPVLRLCDALGTLTTSTSNPPPQPPPTSSPP